MFFAYNKEDWVIVCDVFIMFFAYTKKIESLCVTSL